LPISDEIFCDPVEISSCHPCFHRALHELHSLGEDFTAPGHDLDLTLGLELDHGSSAFIARAVISSRSPAALILTRFIFRSFTQSITGSVCSRYTFSLLRMDSGSSSFRRT